MQTPIDHFKPLVLRGTFIKINDCKYLGEISRDRTNAKFHFVSRALSRSSLIIFKVSPNAKTLNFNKYLSSS